MTRTLALTAALSLALLAAPLAASARTTYCSPTGDYCNRVIVKNDVVKFRTGTFSFRGRVKFCVTDPDGERACRTRRLRRSEGGIWVATARWRGNFPNAGRGTYKVRFYWQGNRLGPALSFRR